MESRRLFSLTRQRLALTSTGTMALILLAFGLGVYHLAAREQWQFLNRKLATVAGTLHDGLEPALEQPGVLIPLATNFLPDLVCHYPAACPQLNLTGDRHLVGIVESQEYYVRFVDINGQLLAYRGQTPQPLTLGIDNQETVTLVDDQGRAYRQNTQFLKTKNHRPWGYLQVGQSLESYQQYLAKLRLILIIALPITVLGIAMASWWLSGLAMQPVYRSYHNQQQFIGDAAHELRTPLAAIASTVEYALEENPLTEAESRHTLTVIDRQTRRLVNLVQDLLLLSRLDLAPTLQPLESCCLQTLVRDLAEEFSALALASQLTLKTQINPVQRLTVPGNEEQLYRLFANLLMNAIHYTPPGGQIEIRLAVHQGSAVLSVRDNGVGIDPQEQSRIFDRFYRVQTDRSCHSGGSGLGLAIAEAIAVAHGAQIRLSSALGVGSHFAVYFRLPLEISRFKVTNKQ